MDILNEIKLIVAKEMNLSPEQLAPETKLSELGGIDSLSIIQIIFALEEKFGISIPVRADDASRLASPAGESEAEGLAMMTIAGIVDVVREHLEAKA
jgi:acyl carrier protein